MMQYALFARPVVTIYDLPQTTKQSEAGLVSTIGDEGLYGQACQVRTAPGGVTAEGVPLSPEVAEVVTFYGYHGFVRRDALKFVSEDALRDYLPQPLVLVGRATDVLSLPKVQGVRMLELERGGVLRRQHETAEEAEAHKGPSLVIAYAPCINHGIAKSMKVSQAEQKLAVECGYWPLFRYSPELAAEGKNPFQLDSKAPNGKLREFMMGEVRFSGLTRTFPQIAEQLFAEAEEQCAARYAQYEKLAAQK